jgi:hypothetical protein
MKVTYVKYVCKNCKAEDTDKLFENEAPAPALDCWNCHAGSKMTLPEMLQSHRGMFPVQKVA